MYEREGCSTSILDRTKRKRDATAWVNEHINDPAAVQKARQVALKQPTHFYHWLKAQPAERINGQKFDPISFMFKGDTGKTVGDTEQAQVMFTLGYRMNGSKKITKTFISGQYWKIDVDDKPNERDGN